MRSREELGRALLACVRDPVPDDLADALAPFAGADLPQLALHASRHRVVPFLARALRHAGIDVPPQAARELERTQAHWAAVHLGALADLTDFRSALDARGVPFLVVKGPVLAEGVYPTPELRTYEDLDLLVRPRDFEATIDALEAGGFALVDRNWTLIRSEHRAQLHLRLTMGTLADVHWHLLNRATVREAFSVSTDSLVARGRDIDLGGTSVRTLDAADTLVHLCVHGTLSGGDRLLWSKDVERVLVAEAPAWDLVIARATEWRAGPSVAIALRRTSRLLGAPVPPEVFRSLDRSGLRRWIVGWVDRRAPQEGSVGTMTVSVFWSQICRATWRSTIVAAISRLGRRSRNAIRSEGAAGAPIFESHGGEPDERRYLRTVSRPEVDPSTSAEPLDGPPEDPAGA